jgi:tetratricopeptide (TPR) repeat protein
MQSSSIHTAKSIKAIIADGRIKEAMEKLQFSAEQKQWLPVAFAARQLRAELRDAEGKLWYPAGKHTETAGTEQQQLLQRVIRLLDQFKAWEKDPAGQAQLFDTEQRAKIDLFLLGIKERRAGKAAKAIRTFTKVIQQEPAFTEAYIERAALLMQQRSPDWEQALNDLNTALRISPNHPLALTNRGYLYVHFYQDLQQACADWQEVQAMGFPLADALINEHCKNR